MLRVAVAVTALTLVPGCESKKGGRLPPDDAPAEVDVCLSDSDCSLVREDHCCSPSPCDEDMQAETAARAARRREACASKDCQPGKRASCSAKDVRTVARCRERRCVIERP
jgi:hypothetical protein